MVDARAKLLKPRDVTACKQFAASDQADSQRAAALLAIHQGATQAAAAESSGLSVGQVKYIVSRFRLRGMQALNLEQDKPATLQEEANSQSNKDKSKKAKNKDKNKKKSKGKDKKAKDKKKDKKNKKKGKKAKKK